MGGCLIDFIQIVSREAHACGLLIHRGKSTISYFRNSHFMGWEGVVYTFCQGWLWDVVN